MKLGLGLYHHQLNEEHYRFARQCGCTHVVIHLVDYFRSSRSRLPDDQPVGDDSGWGLAGDPERLWTCEELASLKTEINAVLPVAEWSGVTLAAHLDHPPMPTVRGQSRLVYQPHLYQKLLDLHPSRRNQREFCLGTLAEMTEGDIYEVVDGYCRQAKLAYVHCRNVRGKVPYYRETFIDDGDIDMLRVLGILKKNDFQGVLVPDHSPQMICAAPWHAGMAYALGYLQAALRALE